MNPITINSDLGESFGLLSFGHDDELLGVIDVANVACGFHSGDPTVMSETVRKAIVAGVAVGAHPGLPDLAGFGRRRMTLSADEVRDIVIYQVGALTGFLAAARTPLSHIKPHGALYGMVASDAALMRPVAEIAARLQVPVYGMAGTEHETVTRSVGAEFVAELYVDLDYDADGGLIIARRPHATDPERVARRVARARDEGVVEAVDGTLIPMSFRSICVHSDTPNCVEVARVVRDQLAVAV